MNHFHAADGARLAYRDEGAGIPVLALAGLTRDGRDFDYLVPHLGDVRLIRLDCRGRGASEWTGAASYTVMQEARDVLDLLDHLALPSAAIIGSSRGGLIGMALAATAKDRLTGLCLNDVGPVLERAGLERIASYLGVPPAARTIEEIAAGLPAASPGFRHVPVSRWQEEASRHFVASGDGIGLTYDPSLRDAFQAAFTGSPADLWPLFDACKGLPLALIRGANSDILTTATAREMKARRPDMIHAEIADRGHIPFLDEPQSLGCVREWLASLLR